MRNLQITIIGAGSTYTPELIRGFIDRKDSLAVNRFVFCDIDDRRNNILGGLSRRMLDRAGIKADIVLTNNMKEAVKGADYILAQIRQGCMDARIRDEKIPLRHGLLGQETTGIGGMVNAFRTIPVIRELCSLARKLAPEAWTINFSNPSGLVAEALADEFGSRLIGLCNIPVTMSSMAKSLLEAGDDFDFDYIGLNHLSWMTEAYSAGRECLNELLMEPAMGSVMANIPGVPFSQELLRAVEGFPCDYLKYYYFRDEMLKKCRDAEKTRGEECLELERKLLEIYEDEALDVAPPELEKRGGSKYSEAAASLIESIENDRGDVQVVNVRSGGAVPFLGSGDVAELKCRITRGGAEPLPLRRDPGVHIKGFIQMMKAYEKLASRAALTGHFSDAVAALMSNPLTQNYAGAVSALREMLDANREFLPQFNSYFAEREGDTHG